MGLKQIFSNNFETNDPGINQNLTTHYYSAYYEEAKDVIIAIAKSLDMQVANIDNKYKEILIYAKRADIIVTLCSVGAHFVSVDFKVNTSYIIGLNRGEKLIAKLYEQLNKRLTLKQIGGYYHG